MLVYATPDELTTFLGEAAPDNADRLLRGASGLVRSATRAALYDVTSTGMPSDPDIAEAFRDATCAQAAEWISSGVNPAAGTSPGTPKASGIGGANVQWDSPGGLTPEQTLTQLIPDAVWYLDSAGLLSGTVQVWG
jgi:hypothetical protein